VTRRTVVLGLAVVGALLSPLEGTAQAEIVGDRFRSTEWRVTMVAPRNWQITDQTSYPNILLWMVRHNPPGKMLLAAERVAAETDVLTYAATTTKVLQAMGFVVRTPQLHGATGAYWIDFDNGTVFLRQAFLVTGGFGYALTLSAPDARLRTQHLRAFDQALRSISPHRGRNEPAAAPAGDEPAGEPDAPDRPGAPSGEAP
jgi:hypothetical protein